MSRIYWNGKFLDYPLSDTDVIKKLGPVELTRACISYLGAGQAQGRGGNLEQWVSNRFGRRLYKLFFKTYREKVWGAPCTEIRASGPPSASTDGRVACSSAPPAPRRSCA